MFNYLQPPQYHFSQDSVLLANYLANLARQQNFKNICEIGSGCGVISIEFIIKSDIRAHFDLIEVQDAFTVPLKSNLFQLSQMNESTVNIIHKNFSEYTPSKKIDLFYFNPPFSFIGEGRRSKNIVKDRCHFIEKDELQSICKKVREICHKGTHFVLVLNLKKSLAVEKEIKSIFSNFSLNETIVENSKIIHFTR